MMGPLSVAQYLAPGALNFDLVIMDEASQIRPEDAIGAVARGAQLVVVGDDKQLPPTSFFDRLGAGVDDGDGLDGNGGFVGQNDGSVLSLANGSFGGRQNMLRWHYRSRHPELIAFSNHQFYNNDLVIFPAPQESDHQLGLTRIFVEDGCAANGENDAEARCVAEAAVDHLQSRPSHSLMIVAMNIKQKECIQSHIAKLQTDNGGLGEVLDESEADTRIEPFVVKNLENVQGDERDVVIISMTYGPPQPGMRVPQTFGPINQANGHRRLNVLFTRAKERMLVFTSMRSSDIQVGPGSSLGVQALRNFLWFAETKQLPSGVRVTGKPPESPFEEAVARELERVGYKVEPQLGVGSYRIDIAVRNPDAPQQFLLGVECDGAMYHSTLSARDRDRLRQEVLENLGWEIERIWSVDWFRDPACEMQRVLKRLDLLRQLANIERPAAPQNSEEAGELTEEAPIKIEPTPRKQIEGLPRELKKALAARSIPIVRSRRVLTKEETRAALIALREKIDIECPDTDPSRGLLRQTVLEELLRRRPADADEWRAKIPLDLRQATDGEQFKRYGEDVFEILAGTNTLPAHQLAG
jgi:very-short-patch-repair endonuclease